MFRFARYDEIKVIQHGIKSRYGMERLFEAVGRERKKNWLELAQDACKNCLRLRRKKEEEKLQKEWKARAQKREKWSYERKSKSGIRNVNGVYSNEKCYVDRCCNQSDPDDRLDLART